MSRKPRGVGVLVGGVALASALHAPAFADVPTEPPASDVIVEVREPGPWRPTFGLGLNAMLVDDVLAWAGILWAGVQYEDCGVYVHGRVGVALGSEDARRAGLEANLAAGYFPVPWLSLGAYGQIGQTSTDVADPWLERTWEAGVELAQCLDDSIVPALGKTQLCATERWAPVGRRFLRGVVIDDRTYVLPTEDDPFISWELTFELRAGL
jgi:hypothetical protein